MLGIFGVRSLVLPLLCASECMCVCARSPSAHARDAQSCFDLVRVFCNMHIILFLSVYTHT